LWLRGVGAHICQTMSETKDRAMDQGEHHYSFFETAHGFCGIAWHGAAITRFMLPSRTADAADRAIAKRMPRATPAVPPPRVSDIVAAAKRYFAGEPIDFSTVELDLTDQDDQFRTIYAATRRVGWGHTTTYGTLAKQLGGSWEMARDIGQAMARNPAPLIIPCHRVLAAGGKVGGFSAPGGSMAKLRMLELEGVHLGPPAAAQQSLGL
jgi:methylated-DNA-[protein]-cysteine S-methyltransferase